MVDCSVSLLGFVLMIRPALVIKSNITVSRPMNCVAWKMWGIHDAVHAHKTRHHFRFSLTSIPNIPKRDLNGCPSRPWKDNRVIAIVEMCEKRSHFRLVLAVEEMKIAPPETCEKYFVYYKDNFQRPPRGNTLKLSRVMSKSTQTSIICCFLFKRRILFTCSIDRLLVFLIVYSDPFKKIYGLHYFTSFWWQKYKNSTKKAAFVSLYFIVCMLSIKRFQLLPFLGNFQHRVKCKMAAITTPF